MLKNFYVLCQKVAPAAQTPSQTFKNRKNRDGSYLGQALLRNGKQGQALLRKKTNKPRAEAAAPVVITRCGKNHGQALPRKKTNEPRAETATSVVITHCPAALPMF
ncbi:hypothetical protein [Marinobacter segnicrescens]|uniref:hypothetical protein n=1 Tax=Marinobacter segnicrescens TaxID=430453 RepID=UPI00115FF33B|nr:hypothetical protein [Marinobacter segnicrescens]